MNERGRARRADLAEARPRGPRRPSRRGLWVMIAFCLVVFVVIVAAETRTQLTHQAEQAPPATDIATTPEEATANAGLEQVSLLKRLKEYYRSHELPVGWVVAGIDAPRDDAATVRIVFSPAVLDRRYGQPAPAEDVANARFCPDAPALWAAVNGAAISAELGDKTGVIKTIACAAATTR